jgi:DNA helicase HerA-like ATPase
MANRHGLITGATGTGKTVTLQKLAESFRKSAPVFMADVKGDLTGIAERAKVGETAGAAGKNRRHRLAAARQPGGAMGYFRRERPPGSRDGFRSRAAAAGAPAQSQRGSVRVLNIIFRIADDRGLLLLDFKDLRAITQYIGDNAKAFQNQYGNISSASVGRFSADC